MKQNTAWSVFYVCFGFESACTPILIYDKLKLLEVECMLWEFLYVKYGIVQQRNVKNY